MFSGAVFVVFPAGFTSGFPGVVVWSVCVVLCVIEYTNASMTGAGKGALLLISNFGILSVSFEIAHSKT